MARLAEKSLSNSNIKLILNDGLKELITENTRVVAVKTNSGKITKCDLVILSIGVRSEIKLAKDSNLEIGEKNGIVTNEYLQTSDPDIFAGIF
jgi:NAD(P)H-nitrite reductase large subunit